MRMVSARKTRLGFTKSSCGSRNRLGLGLAPPIASGGVGFVGAIPALANDAGVRCIVVPVRVSADGLDAVDLPMTEVTGDVLAPAQAFLTALRLRLDALTHAPERTIHNTVCQRFVASF